MKETVRASVVQFASEWLQPEKNAERLRALAEGEAREGQELIVFPELANVGYISPAMPGGACEYPGVSYAGFAAAYVQAAEPIPGRTTSALAEVARRFGVYIVAGVAQRHPMVPYTLYNASALIGPGGVIGVHHKMHIPLNEKHFFYPGSTAEVFATDLGAIGMQICYDGRFPEITRVLALSGAEIICSPWCVPAAPSVPDFENSLRYRTYTRAQENGVYFISCNRSGWEGKTQMMGRSVVSAPDGSIIASSSTADEEVLRVELTEKRLLRYRSMFALFRDRRPDMYGLITRPLSEPYSGASRSPAGPGGTSPPATGDAEGPL